VQAVAGWLVELWLCCGWPVAFVSRTHFLDASGDAIESIVLYWKKRVCPAQLYASLEILRFYMHGTAAWPVNNPGTHSNRAFVFLLVRPSLFLSSEVLSFSLMYLSTDSLYHQQATLVSEI
jgi:hypothetical protein